MGASAGKNQNGSRFVDFRSFEVNLNMETQKKNRLKIKPVRREKADMEKGVNTLKFCGILKLKENPLAIQKRLRDEWK